MPRVSFAAPLYSPLDRVHRHTRADTHTSSRAICGPWYLWGLRLLSACDTRRYRPRARRCSRLHLGLFPCIRSRGPCRCIHPALKTIRPRQGILIRLPTGKALPVRALSLGPRFPPAIRMHALPARHAPHFNPARRAISNGVSRRSGPARRSAPRRSSVHRSCRKYVAGKGANS